MENPRVFWDIAINGEDQGRVVMELRADIAPKTCENFRFVAQINASELERLQLGCGLTCQIGANACQGAMHGRAWRGEVREAPSL